MGSNTQPTNRKYHELLYRDFQYYDLHASLLYHELLYHDLLSHDLHAGLLSHDLWYHDLLSHDLQYHDLRYHDLQYHDLRYHDLLYDDLRYHDLLSHDLRSRLLSHDLLSHDLRAGLLLLESVAVVHAPKSRLDLGGGRLLTLLLDHLRGVMLTIFRLNLQSSVLLLWVARINVRFLWQQRNNEKRMVIDSIHVIHLRYLKWYTIFTVFNSWYFFWIVGY